MLHDRLMAAFVKFLDKCDDEYSLNKMVTDRKAGLRPKSMNWGCLTERFQFEKHGLTQKVWISLLPK